MSHHRSLGFAPLAASLATLVLGTLPVGSQESTERSVPPVQRLSQGIHALSQGDHTTAREHFRALVATAPDHGPGLYYLAVTEFNLRNPDAGFVALEEAVACGFITDPTALRSDPYLKESMERDDLRTRWQEFTQRMDDRQHGLVRGLAFTFRLQDADGKVYAPASFAGRCLAVVFLQPDSSNSLGAAYQLEKLQGERTDLAVVGIVSVPSQELLQQIETLTQYRDATRLRIPLLLAEPGVTQQLRPFRGAPTVLFLDAQGQPQRIVEAAGAELETRLRAALAALTPVEASPSPPGATSKPAPTTRPGPPRTDH